MITKQYIVLMFTLFCCSAMADTPKQITLGVTPKTLKSSQGKFVKAVLSEALAKINFKLVIHTYPSIRLAKVVASGDVDGELLRMSTYAKKHPYLTRVDESYFKFSVVSYSSNKKYKHKSWKDLLKYRVGFRRGIKVVSNELLKITHSNNVNFTSIERPVKLMLVNRLDVYVGIEYYVDEYLSSDKKLADKIFKMNKFKTDATHSYLGKKYAHLAPLISQQFILMKKSGRFLEIRKGLNK